MTLDHLAITREDLSKSRTCFEVSSLVEMQTRSYKEFLQLDIPPEKRTDRGLQAALTSVFPIVDYNRAATLEFVSYSLGEVKYNARDCIEHGMTYAASLRIRVKLIVLHKTEQEGSQEIRDVKEQTQEIYVGELPLMTGRGTFIINGTERVIVSQLHRSPGVTFMHDRGKTYASGKVLFSARVIPYRGSWLDFEFDTRDVLYVRIDRRRKMPATVLLKAFGYSTEQILKMYYPIEEITCVKGKLFRKLDAEIHAGLRSPANVRDKKRSDELVVREGQKLSRSVIQKMISAGAKTIPITPEELVGRTTLLDILDTSTKEILVEKNSVIAETSLEALRAGKISGFKVTYVPPAVVPVIQGTLAAEKACSTDEAMVEVYKRLRPGETPTVETSRALFENTFFNSKRYDLSPVGRLKLNNRLGLDVPLDDRTLNAKDIVEVVRYLVQLNEGKGDIDDIDHLGNRRVRAVGELLENQFRLGLVWMERNVRERMTLSDLEMVQPHDVVNVKPIIAAIKEFFASSQLSQFMDQTNPLAEITHKRRLSALGPGGLTRDRAGFEVRDVHPSHYSRICPIETPEGPNIGLITSLATYARINHFGFIEAPYRRVSNGEVTDDIEYLSAVGGERNTVAQANSQLDSEGRLVSQSVSARLDGDFVLVPPKKVEYMDVSPKQVVGVASALIPFLEHDDANRALMGSNMQRQAVPLLHPKAPVVGTGMESIVARDSGYVVQAKRSGVVESVSATRIVVSVPRVGTLKQDIGLDVYHLLKFQRSNQNTCLNQRPVVCVGQSVTKGQLLADGPAIQHGDLALGNNVLVAFMPWGGYNFEDAILMSESLVREESFTSVHIDEFDIEARETKLGKEEITRDIPNVGEEALRNLDDSGIIRVGAEVKAGDILVGKVTPKGETQLTPEEKLLRAIFGEKAGDVKDTSLTVPPGTEGIVVNVKVLSRRRSDDDDWVKSFEDQDLKVLKQNQRDELGIVKGERNRKSRNLLIGMQVGKDLVDSETGTVLLANNGCLTAEILERIADEDIQEIILAKASDKDALDHIFALAKEHIEVLQASHDAKISRLRRGSDLPPGVLKLVKVYVAMKRKVSVGDKMAGRHGNKGVVSRILPEEDMPYLPDGRPIDIVLNPLGVPSRMNVGQVLETHLGWAAKTLGLYVSTPVFDGATEQEIRTLLKKAGLPESGQTKLYDGRTGEEFASPVTVGYMYMLKLHHLVDDKIHARSIGPYSLVTQQPLGGKAQFGGQRLGEMEVWALQSYGAASTLQEFLTVKSDDVPGRSRIYEAIVKGENFLDPGLPESFNVLVKELQSLGLDIDLKSSEVS